MSGYNSFSEFYDEMMVNADYPKRAKVFQKFIKKYGLKNTKTMLDAACGTGELTFIFREMGFDMVAVDISEDMLSVAYDKKAERGADDVLFLCQDLSELDLNDTVDCAVCALDSLNHIVDTKALQKALSRISLFLNKGGVFVFDVNTLYKHKEILSNNSFILENESAFLAWQNSYLGDGVVEIELDIFEKTDNGYIRHNECFREKAYPHNKILNMCEKAGLTYVGAFDEKGLKEPEEDSQRVYYVFRK